MATPRHMLVDDQHACDYHLASRCVRRAWLCGRDKRSGKDYSHRRQWLVDRLLMLARCFAVEIYAYAVMSNHFHIVLHYDPNACQTWSDEEVARRWIEAFPPKPGGDEPEATAAAARALLLSDPARLIRARRTLARLRQLKAFCIRKSLICGSRKQKVGTTGAAQGSLEEGAARVF